MARTWPYDFKFQITDFRLKLMIERLIEKSVVLREIFAGQTCISSSLDGRTVYDDREKSPAKSRSKQLPLF
jgi:hypothetical protein